MDIFDFAAPRSHSFTYQFFIEACRQIGNFSLHIIIIPDEVCIILLRIKAGIVLFILREDASVILITYRADCRFVSLLRHLKLIYISIRLAN